MLPDFGINCQTFIFPPAAALALRWLREQMEAATRVK
jgi:hypothetical protein